MMRAAWIQGLVIGMVLFPAWSGKALTLEELRANENLTPEKFMREFRNFTYTYHDRIQKPEVFLFTQSGDCDDFATLADLLLTENGYTTKLVSVRMPGLNHVVCYVKETGSYIDFNNRGFLLKRSVKCRNDLEAIAEKVARTFQADWISAAEFTYKDGIKRLVNTVVKTRKYIKNP